MWNRTEDKDEETSTESDIQISKIDVDCFVQIVMFKTSEFSFNKNPTETDPLSSGIMLMMVSSCLFLFEDSIEVSGSDHSGSVLVVCNVTTESFQPSRMHELKKASSFDAKFPFSIDSVICKNLAAHIARTKL
ncbi:hypothetical protein LXL04_026959 [Taraxacum kok-saghyz]